MAAHRPPLSGSWCRGLGVTILTFFLARRACRSGTPAAGPGDSDVAEEICHARV
jgi:hypothetical protein